MTPEAALIELLERIGAGQDAVALVTNHELTRWPDEAVTAMKAQKLIVTARPATSAICPGCERDCMMPVETIPVASGEPALFVVCDKRSDINRVAISPNHLTQWRASTSTIVQFVTKSLAMREQSTLTDATGTLRIGIVKGRVKSQMLCLSPAEELVLRAGSNALPVADVIAFAKRRYALDVPAIRRLVDTSTTSDARYTPGNARQEARKLETQARKQGWQKAYQKLKKDHPDKSDNWCAIQISKMPIAKNRSSETIRKHMK